MRLFSNRGQIAADTFPPWHQYVASLTQRQVSACSGSLSLVYGHRRRWNGLLPLSLRIELRTAPYAHSTVTVCLCAFDSLLLHFAAERTALLAVAGDGRLKKRSALNCI